MRRQVYIIRVLLSLALAGLSSCFMPSVGIGLWPVLFLFPNCLCCGYVDCIACSAMPSVGFDVTITGVVNIGVPDCLVCTTVDGVYSFTSTERAASCVWLLAVGGPCTITQHEFRFSALGGGPPDYHCQHQITQTGGTQTWSEDVAGQFSCSTFSSHNLPNNSNSTSNCDYRFATADATAT